MDTSLSLRGEDKNKNIGLIVTAIVHLLLTLFCFFYYFSQKAPVPSPLSGIEIIFGDPEEGGDGEQAQSNEELIVDETATPNKDAIDDNSAATTKETESKSSSKEKEQADTKSKVLLEESIVSAVEKQANKKAAEDAIAKQKADEIAKAEKSKRDAEAKKEAEYNEKKKMFSDLLGKGTGTGNTNNNQGDPDGNPDADVLDKMSKGTGVVGEGLVSRSVVSAPAINENSQKTGKVAVDICINQDGKVLSANYTQKGSTTTDANLVKVAEKAAKKYTFTPSITTKQCGVIVIEFKLK